MKIFMESILFSKYFLQTASEQDKENLKSRLLEFISEKNLHTENNSKVGRGKVAELSINNKNIFLRKFYRGGLLSKFITNTFFHLDFCQNSFCNNYRPFLEIEILELLNNNQIPSPKPIAAFIKTKFFNVFYQATIATEKIENTVNFLDLVKEYNKTPSDSLKNRIAEISTQVGRIANQILNLGIFHVDLHLGNVLIDSNNQVFIIDFDRAKNITPRYKKFFSLLLKNRWLKSCKKYQITDIAVTTFNLGLNNG